jgi:hypothetical protein
LPSVDLLIEAACNDGRYLDLAVEQGTGYLGIDLVWRHVDAGRHRIDQLGLPTDEYDFRVGDAGMLDDVLARSELPGRCLVVLPFAIVSALPDLDRMASALCTLDFPFVLTSYDPNDTATEIRREYYRRCGYTAVTVRHSEDGVSLHTPDGLSTVAYRPEVLSRLWQRHGIQARRVPLSVLGAAWVSTAAVTHLGGQPISAPRDRRSSK